MNQRDLTGHWTINANNFTGKLELWLTENVLNGRIWFDASQQWEILTNISFNTSTDEVQFERSDPSQHYIGKLAFDGIVGTFIDNSQSYQWQALRFWSHLSRIESVKPSVKFVTMRAAAPTAPKVLVLIEERLLGGLQASFSGGSSVLHRYLDDLQNENWEVYAYRYDVRSDETGEQNHRHLPSEVLQLYKYIRRFYYASEGLLSGVVLVGDFPAAGTCSLEDRQVPGNPVLEQHEMDYFCVDAMLADPYGYWEWLPVAPMVSPGSLEIFHLPYDEGRHPNGSLYPRNQWSAPGFVHNNQSEVHHSQRSRSRYGSEPKYWIGRITAAQVAWRTGIQGWEYSMEEEIRLLVDYFNRNHAHRSIRRNIINGYILITDPNLADWQSERDKMQAVISQANISVNINDSTVADGQKASITNYISSFQQEYLVCECIMHSDWLNHYFPSEFGQNTFPSTFPASYTSLGSSFSIPLLPSSGIKSSHILAIPNKASTSRFYLLGGCDVGAILHRPQFLTDGEYISPATPLHRQYGANGLGIAYLMHANGLTVLAHNVTNPVGNYTFVYQAWQQGKSFGEGVLKMMQDENNVQKAPYYRNVVFGDPTLRLLY